MSPPGASSGADQLVAAAIQRLTQEDVAGGERLLDKALQVDPRNVSALRVYGQLHRNHGRHAQAAAAYGALLSVAPGDLDALYARASALLALNRAREALPGLDRLVKAAPDFAPGHHGRGVALSALRRFEEALQSFDRARRLEPHNVSTLNNRGVALQELGRFVEALDCFDQVIELDPDNSAAFSNRGGVLRELGRHAESVASSEQALALNPLDLSALNNLGSALHALGRLPQAEMAYRRVLGVQPNLVPVLNNLADLLAELGRTEEAIALCDRALKLAPKSVASYDTLGVLLGDLGDIAEAIDCFDEAIALEPRRARTYYHLSKVLYFRPRDTRLRAMEDLAADPKGLSPEDLVELHYGLGRAYAHLGDHARAFERFAEGARRKRGLIAYDEGAEFDLMDRITRAFSEDALWRTKGVGDPSDAPVFLVGMPRSGLALVERVLAGHPGVFAAGAGAGFGRVMAGLSPGGEPLVFPEGHARLRGPALRAMGAAYVEGLRAQAPDAIRFVDRAPMNLHGLGLIHLALPKARIIHVRRDPLDTCISCFTELFPRGHPYSYDLGELGRYYRAQEALMEHWQEVLPEGVMLEVGYEDLVRDPEAEAGRIGDHCGLALDTLDVRAGSGEGPASRPIHRNSIGQGRAFEPWLGLLVEALGGRA